MASAPTSPPDAPLNPVLQGYNPAHQNGVRREVVNGAERIPVVMDAGSQPANWRHRGLHITFQRSQTCRCQCYRTSSGILARSSIMTGKRANGLVRLGLELAVALLLHERFGHASTAFNALLSVKRYGAWNSDWRQRTLGQL